MGDRDERDRADDEEQEAPVADAADEGYQYGWEAGMRGALAVRDWSDVEPDLRDGWAAHHAGLACGVDHDWKDVRGSVLNGWDDARAELQASL